METPSTRDSNDPHGRGVSRSQGRNACKPQTVLATLKRWARTRRAGRVSAVHYVMGWRPRDMPRGAWKSIRGPVWIIWVLCTPVLSCGVGALWLLLHWQESAAAHPVLTARVMFIWSMAGLAGSICLWAIPIIRKGRFERVVRALGYEVCLHCGYSLWGLPEQHTCPECGTAYSKDMLRREWPLWFGERKSSTARNARARKP